MISNKIVSTGPDDNIVVSQIVDAKFSIWMLLQHDYNQKSRKITKKKANMQTFIYKCIKILYFFSINAKIFVSSD